MKKYTVEFWYNTDLRCHAEVDADNEVAALVLASLKHKTKNWCSNDFGFYIKIYIK